MKNLDTSIQEAANYVLARGAVDGNEHIVLVGPDGKFVAYADGNANEVEMEVPSTLRGSGAVVVHNHPGDIGGSLSLEDIMNATELRIPVYAVDNDGSVYSSTGFPRQDNDDIAAYNGAEMILKLHLSIMKRAGGVEKDVMNIAAHVINLLCHAKGLYQYEYKLGPKTQALMDKYAKVLKPLLSAAGVE